MRRYELRCYERIRSPGRRWRDQRVDQTLRRRSADAQPIVQSARIDHDKKLDLSERVSVFCTMILDYILRSRWIALYCKCSERIFDAHVDKRTSDMSKAQQFEHEQKYLDFVGGGAFDRCFAHPDDDELVILYTCTWAKVELYREYGMLHDVDYGYAWVQRGAYGRWVKRRIYRLVITRLYSWDNRESTWMWFTKRIDETMLSSTARWELARERSRKEQDEHDRSWWEIRDHQTWDEIKALRTLWDAYSPNYATKEDDRHTLLKVAAYVVSHKSDFPIHYKTFLVAQRVLRSNPRLSAKLDMHGGNYMEDTWGDVIAIDAINYEYWA